MNRHNSPLKRFSQNFLMNPHYRQRIVEALEIRPEDAVLEIGPGRGALSEYIISARPQSYTAVEIDRRWAAELKQKFGEAIHILNADFMEVDLAELCTESGQRLKIIGNLPYHITSPILFRLIDHYRQLHSAVIMMQKEVARRICASSGSKDYGILSISSQAYADVAYLFEVTRGNFNPAPNVDSAVIKLTFYERLEGVDDELLFRKVIRHTFNYRRKMLRSSLSRLIEKGKLLKLDFPDLERRPEELTVGEFKQLANSIYRLS